MCDGSVWLRGLGPVAVGPLTDFDQSNQPASICSLAQSIYTELTVLQRKSPNVCEFNMVFLYFELYLIILHWYSLFFLSFSFVIFFSDFFFVVVFTMVHRFVTLTKICVSFEMKCTKCWTVASLEYLRTTTMRLHKLLARAHTEPSKVHFEIYLI